MFDITKAAIKAIGPDKPDDWELKPRHHAESIMQEAGAVIRILESDELNEIIGHYDEADAEAVAEQERYKWYSKLAAVTSFLSVGIGSLLLLLYVIEEMRPFTQYIAVLQFVLLVISFGASLYVSRKEQFEIWMRKRAEAETARLGLFNSVMQRQETAKDGELPLLPLKLEYFRRFQLDIQLYYYKTRGEQHARAIRGMNWLRILALMLVSLAVFPVALSAFNIGVPGKLIAGIEDDVFQRVFMFLGLIGAALQGLLASFALISLHQRNAARYHDTYQNLEDLSGKPLSEAREAAVNGDESSVLAFVALVHEQISSEHREWVALRSLDPDLRLKTLREIGLPRL
ncbi:MAG: hypothetical protein ACRBBN_19020 [Methyloligellaceae bacterium]